MQLLDTETDSPAEYMYLVLGYTKVCMSDFARWRVLTN
jgi:hypothetical protein